MVCNEIATIYLTFPVCSIRRSALSLATNSKFKFGQVYGRGGRRFVVTGNREAVTTVFCAPAYSPPDQLTRTE